MLYFFKKRKYFFFINPVLHVSCICQLDRDALVFHSDSFQITRVLIYRPSFPERSRILAYFISVDITKVRDGAVVYTAKSAWRAGNRKRRGPVGVVGAPAPVGRVSRDRYGAFRGTQRRLVHPRRDFGGRLET